MSDENAIPAAKVKVIALQTGFYDGVRRREGTIFEVNADDEAQWFQPVEKNELQGSAAADRTSPSTDAPQGETDEGEESAEGDEGDEGDEGSAGEDFDSEEGTDDEDVA